MKSDPVHFVSIPFPLALTKKKAWSCTVNLVFFRPSLTYVLWVFTKRKEEANSFLFKAGRIQRSSVCGGLVGGAGGEGGLSRTPFWLYIFSWDILNKCHLRILRLKKSILLPVGWCKIARWVAVLPCGVWSGSTLFAQTFLSEYVEKIRQYN